MDKEIKKKLEICRKNLSADRLRKGQEWNDYQVYVPVYKQLYEGGLPRVALVKDGEVRLSTHEEYFTYMEFIRK